MTVHNIFIYLLFFIITLSVLSIVFSTLRNGISPMPTSKKVKKCLLQNLPKLVPEDGVIYELGSGWGSLVFRLADHYPLAEIRALESSPIPFYISLTRSIFNSSPKIKFIRQDIFAVDLQNASLIVCYLYPGAMQRLQEKFKNELAQGTWVISNTFAIPGKKAIYTYEVNDLYHSKIYVYQY